MRCCVGLAARHTLLVGHKCFGAGTSTSSLLFCQLQAAARHHKSLELPQLVPRRARWSAMPRPSIHSLTHSHSRTRMHTRTHATQSPPAGHTRTHTHTPPQSCNLSVTMKVQQQGPIQLSCIPSCANSGNVSHRAQSGTRCRVPCKILEITRTECTWPRRRELDLTAAGLQAGGVRIGRLREDFSPRPAPAGIRFDLAFF